MLIENFKSENYGLLMDISLDKHTVSDCESLEQTNVDKQPCLETTMVKNRVY